MHDSEQSSCETDNEEKGNRPVFKTAGIYQNISWDPKIQVSDHSSDDEPSNVGYNDFDSDVEASELESQSGNHVSRLDKSVSSWCVCGNCRTMESELECYCCLAVKRAPLFQTY